MFGTPYSLPPNHTQTSRYSYRPTPLVNIGVQASRKTLACGEHVSAQNCRRECSVQCYRRLQKVETPDVRWWRMDKQNAVCPYSGHYSAVERGEALKECSDSRGLEKGQVKEACPRGPHVTEFCLQSIITCRFRIDACAKIDLQPQNQHFHSHWWMYLALNSLRCLRTLPMRKRAPFPQSVYQFSCFFFNVVKYI